MQPLYNKDGRAVAYIADNKISVYFYDGAPAAWIYQTSLVYAYSGRFLGWLMYGWVCDPRGHPVFFTDRSIGGPRRAVCRPRPARAPRGARPPRRKRQVPPSRPGVATVWSDLHDEKFFDPGPIDPRAPMEDDAGADSEAEAEGDAATAPPAASDPTPEHDE